nr:hypothetical protein Iba_chr13fCG5900 [Ipomoea batatas]
MLSSIPQWTQSHATQPSISLVLLSVAFQFLSMLQGEVVIDIIIIPVIFPLLGYFSPLLFVLSLYYFQIYRVRTLQSLHATNILTKKREPNTLPPHGILKIQQ